MRRLIDCILCIVASAVPLLASVVAQAQDGRWMDDTRISTLMPSMDRVALDAKEDDSALYAHVSGTTAGEHLGWFRSIDDGHTWTVISDNTWTVSDRAIGAAYGFDTLVEVWEYNGNMFRRAFDANTGALLGFGQFTSEGSNVAKEIVVDSNAETIPAHSENFVACAKLLDTQTNTVTLKAYRSTDRGSTWSAATVLVSGPAGNPEYIGDIDLSFAVSGFPYFHVVYENGGVLHEVRSTDAGQTWNAPVLIPVQVPHDSEVSVSAFGVYVIAVGQSPGATHQVVYCNSTDTGVTWSAAKLIDGLDAGPRLPDITMREAIPNAVYRQPDGTLAARFASRVDPDPQNWSSEVSASFGQTDHPIAIVGFGNGNVGVLYARSDDNGYPYFVTRNGVTSDAGSQAISVAERGISVFPNPASVGSVRIVVDPDVLRRGAGTGDGTGGELTASILDVEGRVVRRLSSWRWIGGSTNALWDERDSRGEPVATGVYFVNVRATGGGSGSVPVRIIR